MTRTSSQFTTFSNTTLFKFGIKAQSASRLLIFIGITSSIARILSGKLCENPKINPVFVYQSSLFTGGVSALLLSSTTKYWALAVLMEQATEFLYQHRVTSYLVVWTKKEKQLHSVSNACFIRFQQRLADQLLVSISPHRS